MGAEIAACSETIRERCVICAKLYMFLFMEQITRFCFFSLYIVLIPPESMQMLRLDLVLGGGGEYFW